MTTYAARSRARTPGGPTGRVPSDRIQADSAQSSSSSGRPSGRLGGLDGLRALAITAVVVYHLNPAWLPGGFLGVDIFFVISGFLITTLLLGEHAATGRLDLGSFWLRRARRLLPALLLCLPVSVLLARVAEADLLVGIGRQVLGALTFSSNWLEIAAGADYFNATSPRLFMNLWSLAVEEQFYLFWPLVTWALIRWVGDARVRTGIAVACAFASALGMGLLFDAQAGGTRVYYGTDTHLAGLMTGAALAFWYAGTGHARLRSARFVQYRTRLIMGAGLVLAASLWWLDESRAVTFRGGLALAGVATAVLIACAVGGGTFGRVLDLPPLAWVGSRSYGIYLWHWPVILLVSADWPTTPGAPGFLTNRAWCVLVTLALADLSYRFVETPVRRYGWAGAWRRATDRLARLLRRPVEQWLRAIAALVVAATALVILTAPAQTSTERMLTANAKAATPTASTPSPAPTPTRPKDAGFTMPTGAEIDAFGDSMLVGSVPAMRYYFPGIRLDAKSNRRWSAGLSAITSAGSEVRRAVVLVFGTNAGVDEQQARATLDKLGPKRMVVLVNVHVAMARAKTDNATLARIARDYPNTIVADWNAAVTADPSQLQPDGIHPSMTGQHRFAALVRQAFADLSYAHTGVKVKLKKLPIP